MVAAGLAGEGVDRLWQFHLFEDDAGERRHHRRRRRAVRRRACCSARCCTRFVERHLRDDDPAVPRRLVGLANAGIAVSVLLLAVAPWGVAAAGLVVSGALREASWPLVQAWVNRGADPATRATLNSLVGQAESVGEIAGGPILGAIGATAGVSAALVTSSAVFGVGALLTRWRPEAFAGAGVERWIRKPSADSSPAAMNAPRSPVDATTTPSSGAPKPIARSKPSVNVAMAWLRSSGGAASTTTGKSAG